MSQNYGPNYEQPANYTRTSVSAVASLVLGILGVIQVLPFIGSIAGLILGYAAKNEISHSNGAVTGDGLAQAGVILGWVGIGLTLIGLCLGLLMLIGVFSLPFGFAFCDQLNAGSQLFGLH